MANSKLRDLFLLTEEDAISKLQEFDIIPSSKLCKKEHCMAVKRRGNIYFWRCSKRGCDEKISIRRGTWLEIFYNFDFHVLLDKRIYINSILSG